VFKAEEWENFGLATVDLKPDLFHDRRTFGRTPRPDLAGASRAVPTPTSRTKSGKTSRRVVLSDAEQAFRPLSPVTFTIDRSKPIRALPPSAGPRTPRSWCGCASHGRPRRQIELLLPYATIEPIRNVLLQMFMVEKFRPRPNLGRASRHGNRAGADFRDAVLYEADMPLKQLMKLKVRRHAAAGNALRRADRGALRQCDLTEGRMGRVGDRVAIRVTKQLRSPIPPSRCSRRPEEQTKLMEAQ